MHSLIGLWVAAVMGLNWGHTTQSQSRICMVLTLLVQWVLFAWPNFSLSLLWGLVPLEVRDNCLNGSTLGRNWCSFTLSQGTCSSSCAAQLLKLHHHCSGSLSQQESILCKKTITGRLHSVTLSIIISCGWSYKMVQTFHARELPVQKWCEQIL